jgi:hypothetical protein
MLAGLGFQVVSLMLFAVCGSEFAIRVWRGRGSWNKQYLPVVQSRLFIFFLFGLVVATVTIFARSVYRCIELSGGFDGTLFVNDEWLFMVMEGVMIILACSCLTFLYPVICFKGEWHNVSFPLRKGKYSKVEKPWNVSQSEEDVELTQRDTQAFLN